MRRRFVTEGVLKLMRQLEAKGKSRREIAEQLDMDPATVTRHLGPVRKYEWRRASIC